MAAVSLIVDLDMAYVFMAVVSKSELHVVSLLPQYLLGFSLDCIAQIVS